MPSHFLKPSGFRFDIGLRRGSLDYFRNGGPTSLLAERRTLLQSNPDNYAAEQSGSEAIVREVAEFASQVGRCVLTAPSSQAQGLRSSNDTDDLSQRAKGSPPYLTDLGSTWEPDFVLLDEDLRVQAGCVCSPSFWSLPEKLGQPIDLVHAPVPGLNMELGAKIRTFLDKLKPNEVWERWNWGLAATPELNCHPAMQRPRLTESATLDTTWFRVEHQALVRLRKTQTILFGIRVMVSTLREEMEAAPEFALALRQQLQTMPESVADYKGLSRCRDTLMAKLS
ncbi:MAG: heme-dependent oxidative N-demethylase subunit alpha family protein [Verrucomicrobiaceae bacterium]